MSGEPEIKPSSIWPGTQTLACNVCGHTDRPLRKMYKTVNSAARICDVCFSKYALAKQMFLGLNNEFDRQLTLPVERRGRCTHCGKEQIVVGANGHPPLLCNDCLEECQRIAQQAKAKEEAQTHALHN